MSATSPTSPFDKLGLDAPFAEGIDEVDRYEALPTWNELGESPYAEAQTSEGPWQEGTERLQMVLEDEGLAWLDVEAAEGNAEAFDTEDLALNGEALHEHVHEDEGESLLDDTTPESEYLDDEERDASESYEDYVLQEGFEPEAEAESSAPLTAQQRAWILAPDRSAIERLSDMATRTRFLQQDWSDIEFPGNVPKGQSATSTIKQHWALARSLFNAMAGVVPERRVPTTIRFRDRPAVGVPGQKGQRLYAEARDAFARMHAAAQADGVGLVILSSWRSRARQAAASANQPNPNAVARKASAHMYGLAIDLRMGVPGLPVKETNTRVDRAIAAKAGTSAKMGNLVRMYRSPVYKWMSLRAREFGWYPYRNEPWHWEYNPPGLKARFEGETRGELEREVSGESGRSSWEQTYERSPYAEAEYENEATPSPFLRTFTAKALGVKVAVYVTQAACNARQVEMLVFAHGLDLCKPVFKNRPATFITERPFKLGELVEATGRPIVLVVPFLDWERLDANRMAFGRKWHRLAQPANFNHVAAEALEQARSITGSAALPTVRRLILAGHSRAYGFFDALAHEHASPQMHTGALACPTHVWALDTTYTAPIADWRAWLLSRDDLQATVVYRQGTYRTKGSIVRELATGVRGTEFSKLAAASNGRLTVLPVSAGKVSHCAIPTAYLPRLFATLPAPAASGEYAGEAQLEEFEEGEDYAGLATEAEAESEADPVSSIVISDYPRYGRAMPSIYREMLQPLVTKIIETVSSDGTIRVSIIGHADFDANGREFETRVSVERATVAQQTLLSMLIAQGELAGIPRDKMLAALALTIQGMGTSQPKVRKPINEDQRKKNRRVEFSWEASSKNNKRPPPPRPPPSPNVPTVLRLVNAGVWNRSSTVHIRGEQVVRFVVQNVNVLPTSIVITDMIHGGKQSRSILPGQTVEIEFSMLRAGPTNWTFGIDTRSQTFVVSWQAFSYVPKSQERELEDGEVGEDLASFVTEEEALATGNEVASSEWAEQPADENEGDAPDGFDAFGDVRDSEWGAESNEEAWEAEYEAIDSEEEGLALEAGEEASEAFMLAEDEQSRRTHPQDDVKTDLWSIAFLSSVGGGKKVGGAIALFDLFNRTTNRAHRMSVSALGKASGLPVGVSFRDSGYVKFKTRVPVSFADFHNRLAKLSLKDRIGKSWRSVTIYQVDKVKELMSVEVDNFNLTGWHGFKGMGRTAIHRGNGRPAGNPDYELRLNLPAKEDVPVGFKVSQHDFGLVIRAPGDVLFDFDTDWLHYEADQRLSDIIRYINALPASYARIAVEGHTDSIEKTLGYNLALSKRRARTVLDYFRRNKWAFNKDYAFDAARGFGATKPIMPNKNPDGTDNPDNRAKNRRVEIYLYRKLQQEQEADALGETKEEALAQTKTVVRSDARTGADDVDGTARWYQFAPKGTRITFEATVFPIQFDANTRVATGSIRFTVSVQGTSSVDLGIVRMVDGKASVSTSALPVGRHIVHAHYHPDTTEFRESTDQFELRIE